MPYVSTPNPGQSLGGTRDQMRTNTDLLKQSLAVNHVDLDLADTGKHKFMQIPTNPGPTLPGNLNEGLLYTKTGTNTNLFYSPDAGSVEYQLTRTIDAQSSLFSTNTQYPQAPAVAFETGGWTFLPGGLILQYGTSNPGSIGPSFGTTKFPISFTSAPFIVQVSAICKSSGASINNTISVNNGSVTATKFGWNWQTSTSQYTGFTWIAIGK
jgi:hypothetical protein